MGYTNIPASGGGGDISPNAFWLAKGNIAVATGVGVAIPLAVGANGTTLVADSGETSGVKWAVPAGGGDVVGPGSATDNAIARFDGTTGKVIQNSAVTIADTSGNMAGVGTISSGEITSSSLTANRALISGGSKQIQHSVTTATELSYVNGVTSAIQTQLDAKAVLPIDLTSDVTGVLPVANGGTNSSTSLNNNRVIVSSSSAIVEAAAITAARALISDANGIPTHATTTATEIGYVNGVTSAIQTQLDTKAIGVASAVDSEVALFSSTGGKQLKRATGTGVAHLTSGVLSASAVVLTSEVSGVLPVANGGTNSSSALNNNRVMVSSGSAVVEAAAITASRALASDANGIPVAATTTATELGYVNGVTSAIQTQLNAKASTSQTFSSTVSYIGTLANGTYLLVLKSAIAATITSTTSKCTSGTATATFAIDGTPLGGTANSVSSSEQSQAQASANVVSIGNDVTVAISSASSLVNPVFTIEYTRTLA